MMSNSCLAVFIIWGVSFGNWWVKIATSVPSPEGPHRSTHRLCEVGTFTGHYRWLCHGQEHLYVAAFLSLIDPVGHSLFRM